MSKFDIKCPLLFEKRIYESGKNPGINSVFLV